LSSLYVAGLDGSFHRLLGVPQLLEQL
jgi:hypothetical protein